MTVTYTAKGIVAPCNVYYPPLEVSAPSYKLLRAMVEEASREIYCATKSVNSVSGYDMMSADKEPWSKELIMPQIKWEIVRVVEDDE